MAIRSWHWLDWLASALAIGTVLVIAASLTAQLRLQNHRVTTVPPVADTPRLETPLPAHVRGGSAATVVVTEFIDFECPFCGDYARNTYPRIEEAFVATGRVRYAFRHYPIAAHRFAADAARTAECAGDDNRFWLMRERLLLSSGNLQQSVIRRHAETIPRSSSQFELCMRDPGTAATIDEDIAEARRLGVVATPTFLIGRLRANTNTVVLEKRLVGAQSFELFTTVLDEMLAGIGR